MTPKKAVKKLSKRGLVAAGLFSLLLAANASAYTITVNGEVTDVGSIDDLVASKKLPNSGDATQIDWVKTELWVQGVLGQDYTIDPKLEPLNYYSADNTIAAISLPSKPGYFFVKTGNVESGYDHFLYKNLDELAWGVVDVTEWGTDANIGKISNVGVVDGAPVPVPAAAWLLGSGLIGLVGVRRKFKK